MRMRMTLAALVVAAAAAYGGPAGVRAQDKAPADPLPSWNDGPAKRALLKFVSEVTDPKSEKFVKPPERIATFDNDGTLWCEQPVYFQAIFIVDRVRELAAKDPAMKDKPPLKAILESDRDAMAKLGEQGIAELIAATHTGMTPEDFTRIARLWLESAKHPRFKRPFTECVYQPQLELLAYLRGNGFKTFIVSGGGVDFIRAYAEPAYGIPPEQVIGSSTKTKFELRDGKAVLIKLPELNSIDDKEGKPININLNIGRRPILAFGNSDGDQQMLEYTSSGSGPRLGLILHHDDAEREYAYDRDSKVGRLDKALNEAPKRGWIVVSMKKDFKVVFPPERKKE